MQIIPLDNSSSVSLDFALFESKQDLSHGVVQISHGMAEHLGRYEHFINHLNNEGFHVIIHNHNPLCLVHPLPRMLLQDNF